MKVTELGSGGFWPQACAILCYRDCLWTCVRCCVFLCWLIVPCMNWTEYGRKNAWRALSNFLNSYPKGRSWRTPTESFCVQCSPISDRALLCPTVPRLRPFGLLIKSCTEMKMRTNKEQFWTDIDREYRSTGRKYMAECHFVRHKFDLHSSGIEPGPPRGDGRRLSGWTTKRSL